MKKITIKDIAEAAGVSPATVSRVLSGAGNVSTEVRERVLQYAKTLGYRVHRSTKNRTVAVIVPNYKYIPFEGYLSMACTALSKEIFLRGYRIEIVPSSDIEIINEHLICGAISLMFDDGLEKIWGEKYHIPLVCINTSSRHIDGIYSVWSDEINGMKRAVELLYRNGHRRIGMLTAKAMGYNRSNHYRREGLIKAMQQLGIAQPPEFRSCTLPEKIYEPLGQLLHSGITALICCAEGFSPAAAYALTIYGRKIPTDLSLIGYEYTGVSCFCIPQQTTLRQNFEEISCQTLNLLEQLIDEKTPSEDIMVDYQLIERDTVTTSP